MHCTWPIAPSLLFAYTICHITLEHNRLSQFTMHLRSQRRGSWGPIAQKSGSMYMGVGDPIDPIRQDSPRVFIEGREKGEQ